MLRASVGFREVALGRLHSESSTRPATLPPPSPPSTTQIQL